MKNDLLAAVLRDTGVSRRLLNLNNLSESKALRFPCQRSIGLHVVLNGPVHLHASGLSEPLALGRGDIVLMARGQDHVLSAKPRIDGLEVEHVDVASVGADLSPQGTGRAARVIGGAYQFWHKPLHPLFQEMPDWSMLRADELPRMGPLTMLCSMLEDEVHEGSPGSTIVVQGLLDLVFTYALRHVIARRAADQPGWSQAASDPQIGRVVTLLHDDPAHAWTLDELAKRAGLSRTALAERFRTTMGDTPLNHLRTVRMQRATKLLADANGGTLESVAAAVGYQDAFGFSKVFKRVVGMSPKSFRQLDASERMSTLRF